MSHTLSHQETPARNFPYWSDLETLVRKLSHQEIRSDQESLSGGSWREPGGGWRVAVCAVGALLQCAVGPNTLSSPPASVLTPPLLLSCQIITQFRMNTMAYFLMAILHNLKIMKRLERLGCGTTVRSGSPTSSGLANLTLSLLPRAEHEK